MSPDNMPRPFDPKFCDETPEANELSRLRERVRELESKNTFWACRTHTHNNTLRCAICDEARVKELEEIIRTDPDYAPWAKLGAAEAEIEEQKKLLNRRVSHQKLKAAEATIERVRIVRNDLATQCTNGHAVKALDKALKEKDDE